ncbi:MAG: phytochelatin synthase family protein, partial [Hyphomicrobiales bacterium]|nr:phytochelatin synthase family protein [Hyphomicrobiales bacterium]
SMTMVLNALGAPAPASQEYQPYRVFTQDNLLDATTDAVLPRDVVARQGMTLDQLGALLALRAASEVRHAADGGLEAFRADARAALGAGDRFVLVNYLRSALGQQAGGHISPLAAYDEKTDRFLILDVARYKYPSVWVTASDLFAAMNRIDPVSGTTRGYALVSAKPAAAAQ